MTVPKEYRLASRRFDEFLAEVAEQTGLTTINQAYTVVDGVLRAFRRRLTAEQGVAFAQVLPPILGAVFLSGWEPGEPDADWDMARMTREAQDLRRHHNFAPDTAIRDVAAVLRRHVDGARFEAVFDRLPPQARDFWNADPA